jgi:MarR family transcriptional regulator, organic hydroperoxide resistance regulator
MTSETFAEAERAAAALLRDTPADLSATTMLWQLERVAMAVRQHVEQTVLDRDRLTWNALLVLRVVWVRQPVESREVAMEAGLAKATLTGVVDSLAERGLMRRLGHPADRRLVLLELTAAGRRLARRVLPAAYAAEATAVSVLNPRQVARMDQQLRRVARHLDEAAQERRPRPRSRARRSV